MAEPKTKLEQNLTLAGKLIPRVLAEKTMSLLEVEDLYALTLACPALLAQYKGTLDNKKADKRVALKMGHCAANPNDANFAEFSKLLSIPKRDLQGPPIYLIPIDVKEVYVNEAGVQNTKTIRRNTNVLETILRTRNVHYAKLLFPSIPKKEKTQILKKYIKETRTLPMWGMSELKAAYKNFLDRWQALYNASDRDELASLLSGRIGQAIKENVPWLSICLFCHPATHAETDYRQVPNWVCVLWDNKVLDLDLFGPGSFYALSKGWRSARALPTDGSIFGALGESLVRADLEAFTNQSDVLSSEMHNNIKQFELDYSEPLVPAKTASAAESAHAAKPARAAKPAHG